MTYCGTRPRIVSAFVADLARLTLAEKTLFLELRDDRHAERLRLEQERIGYTWAADAIRAI